jgi:hypothetical protein
MSLPCFEVLDAICQGGSPERANDDAYGSTQRSAFVLDGATSVGDEPLLPGTSDARWVAVESASILTELSKASQDNVESLVAKTVEELIARFTSTRLRAPREPYEIPLASMMFLVASARSLEVGWYGDCRLLAKGADGKLLSAGPGIKAKVREQDGAREVAKASGKSAAAMARQDLLPRLRELRNLANTRTSAGVLGPDPRCVPLLRKDTLDLKLPATALLMSDGFYVLVTDYGLYDDEGLLRAAQLKGLKRLYDDLRAFEAGDPQGTRFPRYKTHDDATALLVSIQ